MHVLTREQGTPELASLKAWRDVLVLIHRMATGV